MRRTGDNEQARPDGRLPFNGFRTTWYREKQSELLPRYWPYIEVRSRVSQRFREVILDNGHSMVLSMFVLPNLSGISIFRPNYAVARSSRDQPPRCHGPLFNCSSGLRSLCV